MKLPKFAGDVQAGEQRAGLPSPGQASQMGTQGGTDSASLCTAPVAGRRETRSTPHTSPTAAATQCINVMGLSWCGERTVCV